MAEVNGNLTLKAKVFGGCSRRKAEALVGCLIRSSKYPEQIVQLPEHRTIFAVREYDKNKTVYVKYHTGRNCKPWIEWSVRSVMIGKGVSVKAARALRSAKDKKPDVTVSYEVPG